MDSNHKRASVGEIEIRYARIDACLGNPIAAVLERAGRIDHEPRTQLSEQRAKVRRAIELGRLRVRELGAEALRLCGVPSANNRMMTGINQPARQPASEPSVT